MQVGDYVRTESGLIGKIIGFKGDMVETDNKRLITYKSDHSECKIKEKPIDLIEVGDIIKKRYKTGLIELIPINKYEDIEDIKLYIKNGFELSIVTKEQFESMEYKVDE